MLIVKLEGYALNNRIMNRNLVLYVSAVGILIIIFSIWLSQYFSYPIYLFGFMISSFLNGFLNYETLFGTYIDAFTTVGAAFIICWLFFSSEFLYMLNIMFSLFIIILYSTFGYIIRVKTNYQL